MEEKKHPVPKVELAKTAELKPYPNNPRVNDAAVDAVAKSISAYGFKNPIVVDAAGVIVCGHTRWKAAQSLGLETVPVIRADDLTDEQVRQYRLVDNKTSELSWWDFSKLDDELKILSEDFDASAFGFDKTDFADDGFEGDFGEADVRQDEELDKSKVTFDIPRDRIADVRKYRAEHGDEKIVNFILECAENA